LRNPNRSFFTANGFQLPAGLTTAGVSCIIAITTAAGSLFERPRSNPSIATVYIVFSNIQFKMIRRMEVAY
jgi:hypothetical protein